eukprot:3086954-Amphidinium_carterae.1
MFPRITPGMVTMGASTADCITRHKHVPICRKTCSKSSSAPAWAILHGSATAYDNPTRPSCRARRFNGSARCSMQVTSKPWPSRIAQETAAAAPTKTCPSTSFPASPAMKVPSATTFRTAHAQL